MNSKRILVLGDGGWGTALALVLHHNGHNVTLWSKFPEYAQYVNKKRENTKFLPGVKLPRTLKVISELIIQNSDLIVMAVPTQFCRSVLKDLRSTLGVYTERSECASRSTLNVVTNCPGCLMQLEYLLLGNPDIRVRHALNLIADVNGAHKTGQPVPHTHK